MLLDKKNPNKFPLMYKGFILRLGKSNVNYKNNNGIGAYSYKLDLFINPLYETFQQIKLVIDNVKQ